VSIPRNSDSTSLARIQTINNVPVGSTCTATETSWPAPYADAACPNWVWTPTTKTASVVISSNGVNKIQVVNDYQCQGGEIGGRPLTVVKDVSVIVGPSGGIFTVQVTCSPPSGTPSQTTVLTLNGPHGRDTLWPPWYWVCTINEYPLPKPLPGWSPPCHWVTTYPQGTSTVIDGVPPVKVLHVLNTEYCGPVPPRASPAPSAQPGPNGGVATPSPSPRPGGPAGGVQTPSPRPSVRPPG
jgi:hypothetical protein